MQTPRWTYAFPTLAVMVLAGCGGPDRDAYADNPDDETTPATTPAVETRTAYAQWDQDQSGDLNDDEFKAWWNQNVATIGWNTDDQDGLTRDEYYDGLVKGIDEDGNGQISREEWQTRTRNLWPNNAAPDFSAVDTDADGSVTTEEARTTLQRQDLYTLADENSDEVIDDEELGNWFRDVFDVNDDDNIDSTEWDSNWFDSGN